MYELVSILCLRPCPGNCRWYISKLSCIWPQLQNVLTFSQSEHSDEIVDTIVQSGDINRYLAAKYKSAGTSKWRLATATSTS